MCAITPSNHSLFKQPHRMNTHQHMQVEIDLALSAHANSRRLYDQKKKTADKAVKTAQGIIYNIIM